MTQNNQTKLTNDAEMQPSSEKNSTASRRHESFQVYRINAFSSLASQISAEPQECHLSDAGASTNTSVPGAADIISTCNDNQAKCLDAFQFYSNPDNLRRERLLQMANDSEEGPIDTSEVVRKTRVSFEVDALTLRWKMMISLLTWNEALNRARTIGSLQLKYEA